MILEINLESMPEELYMRLKEIKEIAENLGADNEVYGPNKISINGTKLRGDVAIGIYTWILDTIDGHNVAYDELNAYVFKISNKRVMIHHKAGHF
ncbi:MAG: hypothetical protein IK062_00315 [Selenomonadaceae bacterium]|nr:hypothetical protein [Selenomonadaceae bacterium]